MWKATRVLRRLAGLSAAQRLWFAVAVSVVMAGHLIVKIIPFAVWYRWVAPRRCDRPHVRIPAETIGREVERAGRAVPGTACLVQAIAAQLLFRMLGFRTELVLGVARKETARIQAHAWVQSVHGPVLVGWLPELNEFVPFANEMLVRGLR